MNKDEINVSYLPFPESVRKRFGMYCSTNENADIVFREIIDNALDESYSCPTCNKILVDNNWAGGYKIVADNGRGLPITMSKDKPEITQAELSITVLHSGSKFEAASDRGSIGMNGVGSSVTNALSESYIILSKITESNYKRSIPAVKKAWEKATPAAKKDLYYILVCEKGIKVHESAGRLKELEKKIYGEARIPLGFSTIILFKPDPEIFESVSAEVPIRNLQYFQLIQEKFYKRKVEVVANGELIKNTFQPFQFEIVKNITPADTSKNKFVSVYVTFDVDPGLSPKELYGSVSGLVVDSGQHLTMFDKCFSEAITSEFKLSHKYTTNGLKAVVIVLASEVVFDSQIKQNLKSIAKVKQTDFAPITKEIIKIFKSNPDYWSAHVNRLNFLAESMKSLSAVDKAKKMIEGDNGNSMYKAKAEYVKKFVDATSSEKDRWKCELFVVEGDSAASPLIGGRRTTKYHAVLPLRGKVLNTTTKSADQAMENKEIFSIFKVLNLGIDVYNVTSNCKTAEEAYNAIKERSRFGKLIISTD